MCNSTCRKMHLAKDESGWMFVIIGFSTNSKVASSCRRTASKNKLTGSVVALALDVVKHTKLVPFKKTLQ